MHHQGSKGMAVRYQGEGRTFGVKVNIPTLTFTCRCIQERSMGQRLNIILVAEGAIDQQGQPITAEGVKKVGALFTSTLLVWVWLGQYWLQLCS